MRKLLAVLMILALLPLYALAEDAAPAEDAAVEQTANALPFDFTVPPEPAAENFTEMGYEDESITVEMYREWFGNAHFNVAHVKIADPSQLRTALANPNNLNKTDHVSTISRNNNAVVAIGGDFFVKDKYGYVVRMTEEFRKKPVKARDMLITDENGDMHIILDSDADQLKTMMDTHTLVNVFNFGPALVVDGFLQEIDPKYVLGNVTGKEPRCAIGQLGPMEYLLVVVDGGEGRSVTITNPDGSTKKSGGCTVAMLAEFMFSKGCVTAYNLDGGNSALMFFNDANFSKKSEKAERDVSDIIYFCTTIMPEETTEETTEE